MSVFLGVNGFFIALFIVIAIVHPPIWGWAVFVIAWCIADYLVIKKTKIHLKYWQWGVLIAVLTIIDLIVLYTTGKL